MASMAVEVHIPELMSTNLFNDDKIFKLYYDDAHSTTYVLQYFLDTKEKYHRFINDMMLLKRKSFGKMGEISLLLFRTLMQTVH